MEIITIIILERECLVCDGRPVTRRRNVTSEACTKDGVTCDTYWKALERIMNLLEACLSCAVSGIYELKTTNGGWTAQPTGLAKRRQCQ